MLCILLCVFQVQVNKPQKRFESLKNTGSSTILVGDLKLMPSHHEQFMQLVTQLVLKRNHWSFSVFFPAVSNRNQLYPFRRSLKQLKMNQSKSTCRRMFAQGTPAGRWDYATIDLASCWNCLQIGSVFSGPRGCWNSLCARSSEGADPTADATCRREDFAAELHLQGSSDTACNCKFGELALWEPNNTCKPWTDTPVFASCWPLESIWGSRACGSCCRPCKL